MPTPPSQHQWYLARDGQQYGPLTDPELAKFVELGHLQPTDLLWREGFPDWRPALVVFPPQGQGLGAPQHAAARNTAPPFADGSDKASPAATHDRAVPETGEEQDETAVETRSRLSLAGLFKKLFPIALLAGAAWAAYTYRDTLMGVVASLPSAPRSAGVAAVVHKGVEIPPLSGFVADSAQLDAKLQATPLWRLLKRDYPDWYADHLKEAAALAGQSKEDGAIAQQLGRALVLLRRQQTDNALSASEPSLKTIAATFYENLAALRKESTEACYAFISRGEASPAIVSLLQGSPHTARLQTQLVAVFEAAADGRKMPRVYPKPRKTDYETLAGALTARGWSQADMKLFSDERELARASPEKICQLVHDWFAAQLDLKDADVQLRLLVESLRPVVAG